MPPSRSFELGHPKICPLIKGNVHVKYIKKLAFNRHLYSGKFASMLVFLLEENVITKLSCEKMFPTIKKMKLILYVSGLTLAQNLL